MEKLVVYADFDWFNEPRYVGNLFQENNKFSFEFSKEWLSDYSEIILSADLSNFTGRQYAQSGLFGCFDDTLPDRWGRMLLKRYEKIQSQHENRPCRAPQSFDCFKHIGDQTRMGGFRFKTSNTSEFINNSQSVPQLKNIKELAQAVITVERSDENKVLPEEKTLFKLIEAGISLGGARPKVNIRDENKELWIAKFPSINDQIDVGAWEYFAQTLAKKAGIETISTKIIPCGQQHIFLIKRFDRQKDTRIHFASAMALLGLKDGDGASTGVGYLDIADKIVQVCSDPQKDIEALYRRVAFSICIGNGDDHFRNHGFLLTSKGWKLSPIYDVNPTIKTEQSLLISKNSNIADLNVLLDASEDYMIERFKAQEIINEVLTAMQDWQKEAIKLGLSSREINIFEERFITHM